MDPFPTKGIEYLLVIGYLALLVPFMWFLSWIGRARATEPTMRPAPSEPGKSSWFQMPAGFHLHRGHSWARAVGSRVVKIGMDDFAHCLIGEPTGFRLPLPGHRLQQGELGWQVCVNDDTVDLLSPVRGKVVEVNENVLRAPALASHDPYGQGWLMKVRVPSHRAALSNLLPGRLANAWIEESSAELSRLMGGQLGAVLQDGGVPVHGIARQLAGDGWPEVAARLLLTGDRPTS